MNVLLRAGHQNSMATLLVGESKTENERQAFEKDIRDMKRMILDPRVMGIRSVLLFIFINFFLMFTPAYA